MNKKDIKKALINSCVNYYLNNNISVASCAEMFGIHRTTLGQHLLQRDSDINTRRKHKINESFFNIIDTQEKAYILGLLLSDGCLKSKRGYITLTLKESDSYLLQQVNECMNNERPIITSKENGFGKTQYMSTIYISSVRIYDDLISKNIFPRKSTREKFYYDMDKSLYRHYIRGIFDGDGWVSVSKNNLCEFGIAMGEDALVGIKYVFENFINVKSYKVSPFKSIFRYRIASYKELMKIYKFLYSDATIYLKRKHDVLFNYCRSKSNTVEDFELLVRN